VSAQLKAQGKGSAKGKAAAIIADNNDSGKSGIEVIGATAESVGMDIVYKEAALPPPPATITDYSPYVQTLMTSNDGKEPDVIFLVVAQSNVFSLGAALNRAGFKGIQTNAVGYVPQLTATANGWSVFTQFATPESPAPEMAKIASSLKEAGIDPIGQPAIAGWLSADMFVGILKKVGKNLTPERFQKAAAKYTFEVEDVAGPTVYPQAFQASTPCGQLVTSNGTSWTVTAPFACYDLLARTKSGSYKEVAYPSGVKSS